MSTTETVPARPDTGPAEPTGSGESGGRLSTMFANILPALRCAGRIRGMLIASAVLAVASTIYELFPYWLVYRLVTDLVASVLDQAPGQPWSDRLPTHGGALLRRAQALVEDFCVRHKIEYTQRGLLRSYAHVLRHLHAIGDPLRRSTPAPANALT